MLHDIDRELHYTRQLLGFEHLSEPVRQALLAVPRHAFVPDALQDAAYDNRPLPIGKSQTISQPYIVAIMTELLQLTPTSRVLEIGAGSGYQTAVLAQVAQYVFSIEIIPSLAKRAATRLQLLDFDNVEIRVGDGYAGWPEAAPFDAIMLTAATAEVPQQLFEQLATGGRLIAPIDAGFDQELTLYTKSEVGKVEQRKLLPVAFVPMTGQAESIPKGP